MASIIRIKRSSGILAPSSLKTAELAYAYGTGTQGNKGDRLFIGTGDNGAGAATAITIIGGSYFTDMMDHVKGTLTASSAILVDSDKKIDQLLSGNIVIDGATNKISGLVDPTDSSGVATKRYVDNLNQLQGILFTGDSGSDSVNLADSGLNFQGQAGEIHTKITNNNLLISLDSSGVVAGTYGATTAVPIITVDDFGRIDSIGTAPASVIFNVTADSGTGDSVNLLDSSLNFSGSTGIKTRVTDNNIDIRLDSTGIVHSSGNFHSTGNRLYGSGTGLEIAVDDFGRISHVVNVSNLAELRVRDDANNPYKSLYTTQNDLIIKEGAGVKVTLTGPTHSGGGADYTPGTFEIAVDSGGTVTAEVVVGDSGTYGTLRADSARFDAIYSRTGQNMTIAPNTDSGGTITIGTRYGNSGGAANNHALDLTNVGLKAGLIKGEAVGTTSLGSWAIPLQSTNLYNDLGFFGGQSHINIRDNADSALTITAMTSLGAATADMMRFNTKDSQVHVHVDQVIDNDKNLVLGSGYLFNNVPQTGRTTLRHDTTDHYFMMHADSSITELEIAGKGVTLIGYDVNNAMYSGMGASTGNGLITLDGNVVPGVGRGMGMYNAGFRRDLGSTSLRFGTVYVDSVDRGHYIDSGTYGSATTVPVFTVNKAGLIDSVGSVASSGVDSASWHPATNTLKITTDAETVHSVQIDDFDTDISIAVDKYINFGTGGKIRKESVDQHLQIINNGTVTVTGTSVDLISTSNDPFKSINARGHIKPVYFPAAGGFDIGESADWTWRNAFFSGNVTSRTDAVDSNHVVLKRQLDSDITSVTLDSASWDKDNHNLNLTIGGNVTQVTINEFDNIKIDGNTISSTDSSNRLFIDPFPVGDSGDLVIRGNLIVEGTETIVNSSVVSLNDKNLVLADSAANSGIADGAGITIGGAQYTGTKPQFVFDAATDRWDPNLPFDIPFASLDSAIFFNGVALREVVEDHLDNFFGVDSNNALSLTYNDVANSMTWKAINATKSQVGVSSFDSSNFSVTAGHVAVTVLDGGTY